ncbi:MAG: methyltransferase domain-containing protein [Alphaproteobacteria bacterium]|nr:MAG: methyltransferase domain-containing protein [Alphaproteobacteria bacterium]
MDQLIAALKAAGEPTRLRILALLDHGELTVTELTEILGQSQPRVSRHLRLLCEAGLLDRFREGTWMFYRLADGGNDDTALARRIVSLISKGDRAIAADAKALEAVRERRAAAAAQYFRRNAADWNRLRSLYVPEQEVEAALLDVVGDRPIGDLLDVGTGTGRMLEIFAARAERALGIDLSRDMLAVARANIEQKALHNCQVRQGDMYRLGLDGESVDVALFHQVLHFAEDPQAAIAECARVLRPGGLVVIADFAPHDVEFLREQHAHRRLGFAADEVAGWCRSAGLIPGPVRHLEGKDKQLTVTVWSATKPGQGARV